MDFFNELGKKFSHAARSVQERTREGVESTRLSSDLRALHSDLDRQLAKLGRAYYESVTANAGEVSEELIQSVRETMDKIDTLTAQRERARQQVRCPGCGSVQAEDARFCSSCGRPMPEKVPEPLEETPGDDVEYCLECGAMRHGQAKFCAVCGHAYGENDALPAVPAHPIHVQEPLEEPEDFSDFEG